MLLDSSTSVVNVEPSVEPWIWNFQVSGAEEQKVIEAWVSVCELPSLHFSQAVISRRFGEADQPWRVFFG